MFTSFLRLLLKMSFANKIFKKRMEEATETIWEMLQRHNREADKQKAEEPVWASAERVMARRRAIEKEEAAKMPLPSPPEPPRVLVMTPWHQEFWMVETLK